jgi:hypothetical protein
VSCSLTGVMDFITIHWFLPSFLPHLVSYTVPLLGTCSVHISTCM